MFFLILLMVLIGIVSIAGIVVFRRYLDKDARYERRLRRRNQIDWENEKLRQERLLEARMHEIHGQGLRWNEDIGSEEISDRSWGRAIEERIPKLD
jgi:hypothetical protein